jgi:hypothetical protein
VRAELYRAHAIEGLDTAFIAATTRDVELRLAMSHACQGAHSQEERILCEKAVIRYHINNSGPAGALFSITWSDGHVETGGPIERNLIEMNFRAYAAYLRGGSERPTTRLTDCRPFVHLNNLAYVAAGTITTVPAPCIESHPDGYLAVTGLPAAVHEFVSSGHFPSEQAHPWSVPGGSATASDLPALNRVVTTMSAAVSP